MRKKKEYKQGEKCKGHERTTKEGQETSAFLVNLVDVNCAACRKSDPALSNEAVTAKMIARKAARKKKQQDKVASSPEEFCKKNVLKQMSNSGSQGHPIDTLEKCLQVYINDVEALENVQFKTIDEVVTAADPDEKTPMTTCGKNKLSFDKTVVDELTTDGEKSMPPYSDEKQKLKCKGSQYNVPGLHREQDEVSRIRSFELRRISHAFHRMLDPSRTRRSARGGTRRRFEKIRAPSR